MKKPGINYRDGFYYRYYCDYVYRPIRLINPRRPTPPPGSEPKPPPVMK